MPEMAAMHKYKFNDQDVGKWGIVVISIYSADMKFESYFYCKFLKYKKRHMAHIYYYNIIVVYARQYMRLYI